jgi:hypothetical protein
MSLFLLQNAAIANTAVPTIKDTGTAIKTLLQFKPLMVARIVEWGICFDATAAAAPVKCELMESDVTATLTTQLAEADVTKLSDPGNVLAADYMTLGTSATGFMGTGASGGEGTTTAQRLFDIQAVPPTGQYIKQFPLGREPIVQKNKFARIRVTSAVNYGVYCYMYVDI